MAAPVLVLAVSFILVVAASAVRRLRARRARRALTPDQRARVIAASLERARRRQQR